MSVPSSPSLSPTPSMYVYADDSYGIFFQPDQDPDPPQTIFLQIQYLIDLSEEARAVELANIQSALREYASSGEKTHAAQTILIYALGEASRETQQLDWTWLVLNPLIAAHPDKDRISSAIRNLAIDFLTRPDFWSLDFETEIQEIQSALQRTIESLFQHPQVLALYDHLLIHQLDGFISSPNFRSSQELRRQFGEEIEAYLFEQIDKTRIVSMFYQHAIVEACLKLEHDSWEEFLPQEKTLFPSLQRQVELLVQEGSFPYMNLEVELQRLVSKAESLIRPTLENEEELERLFSRFTEDSTFNNLKALISFFIMHRFKNDEEILQRVVDLIYPYVLDEAFRISDEFRRSDFDEDTLHLALIPLKQQIWTFSNLRSPRGVHIDTTVSQWVQKAQELMKNSPLLKPEIANTFRQLNVPLVDPASSLNFYDREDLDRDCQCTIL